MHEANPRGAHRLSQPEVALRLTLKGQLSGRQIADALLVVEDEGDLLEVGGADGAVDSVGDAVEAVAEGVEAVRGPRLARLAARRDEGVVAVVGVGAPARVAGRGWGHPVERLVGGHEEAVRGEVSWVGFEGLLGLGGGERGWAYREGGRGRGEGLDEVFFGVDGPGAERGAFVAVCAVDDGDLDEGAAGELLGRLALDEIVVDDGPPRACASGVDVCVEGCGVDGAEAV